MPDCMQNESLTRLLWKAHVNDDVEQAHGCPIKRAA